MSFSTPILTVLSEVLSWAKAGVARLSAANATEAAKRRAILFVMVFLQKWLFAGAQQISLLRIWPARDIPHRAIAARVLFVKPFLNEGSIFPEHLDAVVDAIADIEQPVVGEFYAMHGIGELLRGRSVGVIGRLLFVARRLAVGAPVPLVGAGGRIEHDDATIAVAVGDEDFVGVLVDRGLGGLAELRGIARAVARRDLADLHYELAVAGEFQDRVVVVAIAPD